MELKNQFEFIKSLDDPLTSGIRDNNRSSLKSDNKYLDKDDKSNKIPSENSRSLKFDKLFEFLKNSLQSDDCKIKNMSYKNLQQVKIFKSTLGKDSMMLRKVKSTDNELNFEKSKFWKNTKKISKNNEKSINQIIFRRGSNQNFERSQRLSLIGLDLNIFKDENKNKLSKHRQRKPKLVRTNFNRLENYSHDEESDKEYNPNNFYIFHEGYFKSRWDINILILTFYTSTISPLLIVFKYDCRFFFLLFELYVEIIFMIDIIINFFLSYIDADQNLETSNAEICLKYLFGKFLADVLCSFPVYLFLGRNTTCHLTHKIEVDLFKWLVLLRVHKIFRLKIMNYFESLRIVVRIIKIILIFILTVHIFSCLFINLVFWQTSNNNWLNTFGLSNESFHSIYVASLYFNCVTIFTVGYGDIIPVNINEKIYISVLLLFGNIFYSYAISSLSTLFTLNNNTYQEYKAKLSILRNIETEYEIDAKLNNKLKKYLKSQYRTINLGLFEFINHLSGNLKLELTMIMFRDQIKNLEFFNPQEHEFITFVLPLLKSQSFRRGETLIAIGDYLGEMYLLSNGILSFNLDSAYENIEIGILNDKQHFGEVLIQVNRQCPFQLKCKSMCSSTLILLKSDFLKIKELFPDKTIVILENGFIKLESLERTKKVYLKLFKLINERFKLKRIVNQLDRNLFSSGFNQFFENSDNNVDIYSVNDYFSSEKFRNIKEIFFILLKNGDIHCQLEKFFLTKISSGLTSDQKLNNSNYQKMFNKKSTNNSIQTNIDKKYSQPIIIKINNKSVQNDENPIMSPKKKSILYKQNENFFSEANSSFINYSQKLGNLVSQENKEKIQRMESVIKEKTENLFNKSPKKNITNNFMNTSRKISKLSKVSLINNYNNRNKANQSISLIEKNQLKIENSESFQIENNVLNQKFFGGENVLYLKNKLISLKSILDTISQSKSSNMTPHQSFTQSFLIKLINLHIFQEFGNNLNELISILNGYTLGLEKPINDEILLLGNNKNLILSNDILQKKLMNIMQKLGNLTMINKIKSK